MNDWHHTSSRLAQVDLRLPGAAGAGESRAHDFSAMPRLHCSPERHGRHCVVVCTVQVRCMILMHSAVKSPCSLAVYTSFPAPVPVLPPTEASGCDAHPPAHYPVDCKPLPATASVLPAVQRHGRGVLTGQRRRQRQPTRPPVASAVGPSHRQNQVPSVAAAR